MSERLKRLNSTAFRRSDGSDSSDGSDIPAKTSKYEAPSKSSRALLGVSALALAFSLRHVHRLSLVSHLSLSAGLLYFLARFTSCLCLVHTPKVNSRLDPQIW